MFRTKASIKKDSKAIPTLVFQIEKFETSVIQFEKLTSVTSPLLSFCIHLLFQIDLYSSKFKRSTARDFKIDLSKAEVVEPKKESKKKKRTEKGDTTKQPPKKKAKK